MFHEIKTFCDYHGIKDLHYWRTKDQSEVDFIIDNKIAVEVKGSEVFNNGYLTSLIRLKEEEIIEEFYLIYLGKDLTLEKYPWIKIMNYKNFLTKIYSEHSIES
jgi:predicted AAA+ superfamily ATPase